MPVKTRKLFVLIVANPLLNKRDESGISGWERTHSSAACDVETMRSEAGFAQKSKSLTRDCEELPVLPTWALCL
jgi:hypothetical protein